MKSLVIVETTKKKINKSSLEAISFAKDFSDVVVLIGKTEVDKFKPLATAGAEIIFHAKNGINTETIIDLVKEQDITNVIFSSNCPLASEVTVKINANVINNIIEYLGDMKFKRITYSSKAYSVSDMSLSDKNVLIIKGNVFEVKKTNNKEDIKVIETIAQEPGNILVLEEKKENLEKSLSDADVVVSAGRGMKGPENWKIIEDLAKQLDAATACSKPVADMDWRPHHEHVGQTGVKISPNLYIACGISGAIQHLAGVNNSKVIVVINKDPEAPFFKNADYGIVGDLFEVVPQLLKSLKK